MKLSGDSPYTKAPPQRGEVPVTPFTMRFDGSIAQNPGGDIGWGWCLIVHDQVMARGYGGIPAVEENTVNVAEYNGLLEALEWLEWTHKEDIPVDRIRHVIIEGDSQLVINQVTGAWRARKHLAPLAAQAQGYITRLRVNYGISVHLRWISRDLNEDADELSKLGRLEL